MEAAGDDGLRAIIGAGQAGCRPLSRSPAQGLVALVGEALFGGTCVNTGCTPTKTLVASAEAAHLVRRAGDYGVLVEVPSPWTWRARRARATP